MSDLIDEVRLEHADEKKLKYFKRSLPWVIGLTVLVIIFMAIYDFRAKKQIAHNKEMGDTLVKAMSLKLEDGKVADETLSYLIKESPNGLGDIAMLEKIAVRLQGDNKIEALKELEFTASSAHNNLTRSYARVVWMSIIVDQQQVSDHEKEMMAENLKYFEDEDTEFFGTAQVLGALFNAKNNKIDEARSSLQKVLANSKISPLVKDQAKALLANIQ